MKAIKHLEDIPFMLPNDKATILLVASGRKPAALVVAEGKPYKSVESPENIPQTIMTKYDDIFSELGLSYVFTKEQMGTSDDMYAEVIRFFIAPNISTAKELKNLFDNVSAHHKEIGYLLGYPRTAVDAFLTPDMLDWDEMPVETADVSRQNMQLLEHRLSKKHWQEEVKYLEEWGKYLQSISPKIYAAATKES